MGSPSCLQIETNVSIMFGDDDLLSDVHYEYSCSPHFIVNVSIQLSVVIFEVYCITLSCDTGMVQVMPLMRMRASCP